MDNESMKVKTKLVRKPKAKPAKRTPRLDMNQRAYQTVRLATQDK